MPQVQENGFMIANKIAVVGASLGFVLLVLKRHNILRFVKKLRNPLEGKQIEVIQTFEECQRVINVLKKHCVDYKVLGFDCEWVTVNGTRRPVALLQLSSQNGLCALFRLCCLQQIPRSLRELLEDDSVIKVGVDPRGDAQKLAYDYGVGVTSTFDLRYLAALTQHKPEGLAKLANSVLNVKLDKNWRLACSDWEAVELNTKQLHYAANDALVAVEIFKKLSKKLIPRIFFNFLKPDMKQVFAKLEPFLDLSYHQHLMNNISLSKEHSSTLINKEQSKSTNVKKLQSRGISTRSKALYDNCLLEAPDGELLCTIDRRKAQWYLEQNLAEEIEQQPFRVRLNFEPAGRAVGDVGRYYQTPKENQCVVCGRRDAFIRKNVVPREYRKHFPVIMKSHTSHDVLLLCPSCHQVSNMSDLKVRRQLSHMCNAPYVQEGGVAKYIEVPELKQIKSAARALLINAERIPKERRDYLISLVLNFYNETELTDELLIDAAYTDSRVQNEHYRQHGAKVVEHFQGSTGGLTELEKVWRQHFLQTMQPQFLPALWDVNHNAHRLEIRAAEGRVDRQDLVRAGLVNAVHYPNMSDYDD